MFKGFFKAIDKVLLAEITPTGIKIITDEQRKEKADVWLNETKELLALQRNCEICEMRISHPGIQLPSHRCEQHQRKQLGCGPVV